MRLPRPVPAVLALLLALQWGTAFARCFATHAPGQIEVCTSEGVVHMPWPGDPVPATKASAFACPVCAALPALDAPPAPLASALVVFTPVAFAIAAPRGPPAPVPDRPGKPRAPPFA